MMTGQKGQVQTPSQSKLQKKMEIDVFFYLELEKYFFKFFV